MANISNTTRAQTKFLRSIHKGLKADDFPSAAIMRRWLRRPAFVAAMQSIMTAMRFQSDFQLLCSASTASRILHSAMSSDHHNEHADEIKAMSNLLKISHLRQKDNRKSPVLSLPPVRDGQIIAQLRKMDPNQPIGPFVQFFDRWKKRMEEKEAA